MIAPRYVEFSIQAVLEAIPGTNPAAVQEEAEKELRKRLALVDSAKEVTLRQPGVPVTQRDVAAWLRAADGVKRVIQLQLRRADGRSTRAIAVPRNGLPSLNSGPTTIEVRRPEPGRPQ